MEDVRFLDNKKSDVGKGIWETWLAESHKRHILLLLTALRKDVALFPERHYATLSEGKILTIVLLHLRHLFFEKIVCFFVCFFFLL